METSAAQLSDLESFLKERYSLINDYKFNQFLNYPKKNSNGWADYLLYQVKELEQSKEWNFFFKSFKNEFAVIGCRISRWDEEHFGFKMASVKIFHSPQPGKDTGEYALLLAECLSFLKSQQVRFVSTRINGDDLTSIHFFEETGFRYYETIIWPVTDCMAFSDEMPFVRKAETDDLNILEYIAENYQYQRGHFHCDPGFKIEKVDAMYAKWVQTAFKNPNKSIIVIENESKVAGYFIVEIDKRLTEKLGYRFGRLQSLALDASVRGKGLGAKLFSGALSFLKAEGAEFIDSGYATKNHLSAKLHSKNGFVSAYEEVSLHYWM